MRPNRIRVYYLVTAIMMLIIIINNIKLNDIPINTWQIRIKSLKYVFILK